MTLNRRHLLAGAAAAGAATALPLMPATVRAQGTAPAAGSLEQAPGFYRVRIGDAVVTALSDGSIPLPAEAFPDLPAEDYAAALDAAFVPEETYPGYVNTFLIQRGDDVVLIDAGGTSQLAPTLGRLPQNLAAAGVSPDQVTAVLLTHLHPDHIGALAANGTATFPNAELLVREEEAAFWTDPATRAALPDPFKVFYDMAGAALAPYQGRTTRFAQDGEVMPGIEAVFLPGHTPGHTGFRLASGDQSLLVWGDIVHVAPVQLPQPQVFIGFDAAPQQAVDTRVRVLDQVASDRTMIAGAHLPFPAFGHLVREGEGYRFAPTPWQHTL